MCVTWRLNLGTHLGLSGFQGWTKAGWGLGARCVAERWECCVPKHCVSSGVQMEVDFLSPGLWHRKVYGVHEEIYFVETRADAEPMFRVEAFITGRSTSFMIVWLRLLKTSTRSGTPLLGWIYHESLRAYVQMTCLGTNVELPGIEKARRSSFIYFMFSFLFFVRPLFLQLYL